MKYWIKRKHLAEYAMPADLVGEPLSSEFYVEIETIDEQAPREFFIETTTKRCWPADAPVLDYKGEQPNWHNIIRVKEIDSAPTPTPRDRWINSQGAIANKPLPGYSHFREVIQ